MKNTSPLQIGIFIACGIGIILAVLIFSDKLPIGKKSAQSVSGSVTMWGTLPYAAFKTSSESLAKTYKDVQFQYVQKDPATFQTDLVNALASGAGPDLITITPSELLVNRPRIATIPYASLPQSTYLATFIPQASLFLTNDGVAALPFLVDPLVMYYNRDILTSAFTLNAPATWDDIATLNAAVTKRDDAGALSQQTVALGTFDNVLHAKELIATLAAQAGNSLVVWDDEQKKYRSTVADGDSAASSVARSLAFYTSFANPASTNYSWSSALPADRDQFIAGKLGIYFGFASELSVIRAKNPNLNFDVALFPQRSATATKSTYGAMTGIAIMKMSKNQTTALLVAQELIKAPVVTAYLSAAPGSAPARRDLLGTQTTDARTTLINNSAIIARSWLDPDPAQTKLAFRKAVNDINAGSANADAAIAPINSLITALLEKLQPAPIVTP